ncbi:hypothetical protein HanXRQr2_Chr07g0307871 [Helianthus annuus]|uniref:Uncharacterized protein n=1 Tax=Helianthus annuus TaxID=4232 RepID=A0A251T5N5_HELAN|nr:hypothetical protein HanXRQr2_Chr07g0307871 [Helianthus annuus]
MAHLQASSFSICFFFFLYTPTRQLLLYLFSLPITLSVGPLNSKTPRSVYIVSTATDTDIIWFIFKITSSEKPSHQSPLCL